MKASKDCDEKRESAPRDGMCGALGRSGDELERKLFVAVKVGVEEGFPSGQRGQTVNLVALPSQVRILYPPLRKARNQKSEHGMRNQNVELRHSPF